MCVGAVIIGGAVVTSAVVGALSSSSAAGDAGNAQLSAAQTQVQYAREQLAAQIEQRQKAIEQAQKTAQISPEEISTISDLFKTRGLALDTSLSSIQAQQQALQKIDPSVQESGKNLYNLLTGQSAAVLAPLQEKQQRQRSDLMNRLSSQLGPGFMTSSAGIQALVQFDNESSITLNQAQMQAIQTVGSQYAGLAGLQQQGQASVGSQLQNAFNAAQATNITALQAYETATGRETNALLGAMGANPIQNAMVPNAQGNVIGVAGNPFAGGGALGQGISGIGSGIGQVGGQYLAGQNNLGLINAITNNGGVGTGLSSSIGGYQLPNLGPTFGSTIASGGYSSSLGAATATPNIPIF